MGEFRAMTWNVQNLFEVGAEDGPDTPAEFAAKIDSLAAVIDDLEPHVLCLQEIGSDGALAALQDALNHRMQYRALGVPDDRGIRVAFLSTLVLNDLVDIRPFPAGLLPVQVGDDPDGPDGPQTMNQMGRGALQCTVRANSRDVRVISCHLKSKLLTFPGGRFNARDEDERARFSAYALYRRASEATTLRARLTAELAGTGRTEAVILAGDMNDEVAAATTLILNGPPGSEIGTQGFEQPDNGDGDRMWNLAPLIPEAERFSRVYRGRPELIDHIFASRFLVEESTLESVRTVMAASLDALPSMDDDAGSRRGEPGSDHAAVIARFEF
jgi:endonuclease/exonuclease/phosphatase family metal-dependent hydrolase